MGWEGSKGTGRRPYQGRKPATDGQRPCADNQHRASSTPGKAGGYRISHYMILRPILLGHLTCDGRCCCQNQNKYPYKMQVYYRLSSPDSRTRLCHCRSGETAGRLKMSWRAHDEACRAVVSSRRGSVLRQLRAGVGLKGQHVRCLRECCDREPGTIPGRAYGVGGRYRCLGSNPWREVVAPSG